MAPTEPEAPRNVNRAVEYAQSRESAAQAASPLRLFQKITLYHRLKARDAPGIPRLTHRPLPHSNRSTKEGGFPVSDPDHPDPSDRLRALEARLDKYRKPETEKSHSESHYSQAQLAWRMVIELVAGLLIGFGIGYGLDYLFGTMPIFLVLFIFFGLAAGVKTMLQSAREVQARQMRDAAQAPEARKEEDDARGGRGA
jgi:ATP synthase protein I